MAGGIAGDPVDARVRVAMRAHLDRLLAAHPDGAVPSAEINDFTFADRPLRLIVQSGIWKPAFLEAALTIRTTYTGPNQVPPYADTMGFDGLIRYAYRGPDRDASDNRALRAAWRSGVPLAYFVGVDRGVYRPIYPVWIVHDEPANLRVAVAVDTAQTALFGVAEPAAREYAARMTKVRLHQPVFRSQVLRAYSDSCAMCRLKHPELLDAAHIIPDGEPGGEPVVPNGLSLCKLHHSAFDSNILGVRPDRVIKVGRDVLHEHDGPMLRHGLQELDGQQLGRPHQALALPDPRRLEVRYERFLRAS